MRILKSSFQTWICFYIDFHQCLSISPTYDSLQITLGQWIKYTALRVCSNLVLSFTGNVVNSFVPLRGIPIFPEIGRITILFFVVFSSVSFWFVSNINLFFLQFVFYYDYAPLKRCVRVLI